MLEVLAEGQQMLAERQESQEKLIKDSLTKLLHQESTQLTGKSACW